MPHCPQTALAGGVTAVFHVGALVPYNLSQAYGRDALMAVNVQGTRNLLTAAIACGSVKRFLLASSTGVTFGGEDIAGGCYLG